jgi:Fe-S cluster biogenesis protein NfuA
MAEAFDAREFQARLQRLDSLLSEVDRFPDPAAQAHVREVVQALLDLHGAGLTRILEHLEAAGQGGAAVLDACAGDDVVGGLLLLHGLHPLGLEARVLQALDQVRPQLHAHGGDVELLSINEGAVRLRLVGSCHGCPSSAVTMRQTIEEAIVGKAPDATALEVEGVTANQEPLMTPDGRPLVVLSVP